MVAQRVTTASREEYVGHALDAAIHEARKDLAWARANRWLGWADYERDVALRLRALYRIRREGERQYEAQQAHLRRVYFEALESAQWRRADLGRDLPPVPESELRAMWGDR